MSHAVNIRNRQRPEQPQIASKRRRTSIDQASFPKINGVHPAVNGSYSASAFKVAPKKEFKSPSAAQPVESDAKIRPPDDDQDVEMESSDEEQSDVDEDDGEEDESGSEDGSAMSEGGDSEAEEDEEALIDETGPLTNGFHDEDSAAMGVEQEEPSFADILLSKGQAPIDVQSLYANANLETTALAASTTDRVLSVPTATSLGTVLAQALKTNDVDLLESCFQVQNLESIRATIERLQSSHATSLLQKLAERLHKRPGRAGSLMVWVQWTVVAHGGYLASQPAAMRELHTLYQVVRQRATGLQPLLALKGKLDMLEAQMELRRNMQSFTKTGVRNIERVTYVEGQESSDDEKSKLLEAASGRSKSAPISQKGRNSNLQSRHAASESGSDIEGTDEEVDVDAAQPNGQDLTDGFDDAEDNEADSEDDEDLIDDEAEETDDDSELLSDEVDYDDVDEDEAESDEDEPAPKRSKRAKHV